MDRVFLLSPARATGRRASMLLSPGAQSDVAQRLSRGDAALGDVMSALSSLYFRGKLTYAQRFGQAIGAVPSTLIITAGRGLLLPETRIDAHALIAFATVDVADDERFQAPLVEHARTLDGRLRGAGEVVLLGSVATTKYTAALIDVFGDRLLFPAAFVGRGDLWRGGALLRAVREGRELDYTQVRGAVVTRRSGKRSASVRPRTS